MHKQLLFRARSHCSDFSIRTYNHGASTQILTNGVAPHHIQQVKQCVTCQIHMPASFCGHAPHGTVHDNFSALQRLNSGWLRVLYIIADQHPYIAKFCLNHGIPLALSKNKFFFPPCIHLPHIFYDIAIVINKDTGVVKSSCDIPCLRISRNNVNALILRFFPQSLNKRPVLFLCTLLHLVGRAKIPRIG